MRVVAGRLGGRQFDAPTGHRTHPMSERVRGGLFNVLGDISGLTVLDAYAGSGALGFEAASRGAASVLAIELDKAAFQLVVKNIDKLQLADRVTALRKNIRGWSRNHRTQTFDIVLADPPYNDIHPDVIQSLFYNTKPGGLLVLSWPGSEPVRQFADAEAITVKKFGDAQLVFYRKEVS